MKALIDKLKKPDTYRYIVCAVCFTIIFIESINYVNGGVEYDHLVSFRPICIAFGVIILAMLDLRAWFNIWSLIYVPVCYVATHFLFQNEWYITNIDIFAPYYPDATRMAKAVALVWGIVIIGIIVDAVKYKGYKKIMSVNKLPLIVWLIFSAGLIIFMSKYYYSLYIVISTTAAIYVLLNPERKKIFFETLKDGLVLTFLFIAYKSLRHRPYDTERYMAYFVNSNMGGTFFACINLAIYGRIYDYWKKEKSKKRTAFLIIYLLIFGMSATMTIFNYTRTTLTAQLIAVLALIVVRFIKREKKSEFLSRAGVLLLSIILLFYPTFLAMRYFPPLFNEYTYLAWEYDEEYRIHPGDPIDSPLYTSIESFLTLALGKWGIYVDFDDDSSDNSGDENAIVIDTERDVTNGRVDVWKAYISMLAPIGHYPAHIYIGHEPIYENIGLYYFVSYDEQTQYDTDNLVYHAHDTYLHMSYLYGLIEGAVYLLLCAVVWLFAFVGLVRNKEDDRQSVFVFLTVTVSLFSQVTESIVHPAYILCMMMYFAFAFVISGSDFTLINKNNTNNTNQKNQIKDVEETT